MLSIVATPIGNLKDMTFRGVETLQACDGIICEDSRRTSQLLHHYQITKPLIVLNDFNESRAFPAIIEKLTNGQNLCLVSDAGTPLISDPGFKLVRECISQNIPVDSIPGPSSVTAALTLSGLPTDKFMFLGYLPEKPGKRGEMIESIHKISQIQAMTFILFVAPFKLIKTLTEMQQILGNKEITIAKELTKIYQSVLTKRLSDWIEDFKISSPKGEYILLIHLPQNSSG